MANPFVGQIISVGFNFAPVGWLPCDGSIVPISTYDVLFNLLGTTYGGNGTSTFGLPNLNGQVPLGQGQGQGLSPYILGQQVGTEQVTLLGSNTPQHSHTVSFSQIGATLPSPLPVSGGNVAMGADTAAVLPGFYLANAAGTIALRGDTITSTIGGVPHENRQQFQVLKYVIAYAGIYPSQG